MTKNLLLWIIIGVIMVAIFSSLGPRQTEGQKLSYSQFLQSVEKGDVTTVTVENQTISGITRDGAAFSTFMPMPDQYLLGDLIKKGVNVSGKEPEQQSLLMHIFINWFPMLL